MSKRFRPQFPLSFKDESLFQEIKAKIVQDGLAKTSIALGISSNSKKSTSGLERDILSGNFSIYDLSGRHDVSVSVVESVVTSLLESGYNLVINKQGDVMISNVIPKLPTREIKIDKSGEFLFGAVGDNHLGSRYEDLGALNALYDVFEEEGVKTVFNTGNWIDGEARFNKHDLHTHGLDNQLKYMIEKYPQRDGIKTYYVSGDDHEGWYTQREGIDVGRRLEQDANDSGRYDLINIGHMVSDVLIDTGTENKLKVCVQHPGGGSAFSLSHTTQKIVESFGDGEKPDILLLGHYHKASSFLFKGVHTVQTGCTQERTPFMKKKLLSAHIGGFVIRGTVSKDGTISSFTPTFYNLAKGGWEYKW